jgi:hypothetical protein
MVLQCKSVYLGKKKQVLQGVEFSNSINCESGPLLLTISIFSVKRATFDINFRMLNFNLEVQRFESANDPLSIMSALTLTFSLATHFCAKRSL